jgi:hypothetical protein
MHSESLCGSLILLVLGCLVEGFSKKNIKFLFIVATCFLIVTRFEYLLILPIILIPLIRQQRLRLMSFTIISLSLVLAINGFKNYKIYQKFNPFSYGSGTVLYGGNNLNGDGSWHIGYVTSNYIPNNQYEKYRSFEKLNDKCSCIEQNKFYKELARDSWRKNWMFQLSVIPLKFMKLWLIPNNFDFYTLQTEIISGLQIKSLFDDRIWPWYAKYKHGFYLIIYWGYLIAIILGFVIKIRATGVKKEDIYIISLFLVISFLYSVPFYGLGRFHVPIFGLLILYASFGIQKAFLFFIKKNLKT